MAPTIFISHAGADWPQVASVADGLRGGGISVMVDREELDLGDSFLSFMERSLRSARHCLLLWSKAAADSPWVRVEWEAAFHRTITEHQRFLLVGLLDEHPVPELLRPRLLLSFHPDLQAGVASVLRLCRSDARAESLSGRLVCAPRADADIGRSDRHDETGVPSASGWPDGLPVYVTSELFERTFPWRVPPDWPAVVITNHIVDFLGLPRQIDHDGRVGIRFNYKIAIGEKPAIPSASLSSQGLKENDLLWLMTEVSPFAAAAPVTEALASTTFREAMHLPPWAASVLNERVRELGL